MTTTRRIWLHVNAHLLLRGMCSQCPVRQDIHKTIKGMFQLCCYGNICSYLYPLVTMLNLHVECMGYTSHTRQSSNWILHLELGTRNGTFSAVGCFNVSSSKQDKWARMNSHTLPVLPLLLCKTSKAERSLATSPCFGRGQAEEWDSVADVVKHMILGYESTWWLAAFIPMETLEVGAVWLSHKETHWISFGNFSWFAKLPNWGLRQSFHYTVACERASKSILHKTYLRKHLMKFCHVTKTNQWGSESHTPQFIVVQTFDCSSENVCNNIIRINWILESLCMHYTM